MKTISIILTAAALTLAGSQISLAKTKKHVANKDMQAAVDSCAKSFALANLSFKNEMRTFMRVSKEQTPVVFCQRIINAVLDGRLNYSDINRLAEQRSTQLFLVLRGNTKAPNPPQASGQKKKFHVCNGMEGRSYIPEGKKCPSSAYTFN